MEDNISDTRETMVRIETKLDIHLQAHADQKSSKRWLIGALTGMGSAIAGLTALVVSNYRQIHP